MIVNVTLEEAYARASAVLRRKMEYAVNLLRKAERLALAYDSRGGTTLLSPEAKTPRPCSISPNWQV